MSRVFFLPGEILQIVPPGKKGLKFEDFGDENTTFVKEGIELSNKRLIIYAQQTCILQILLWSMLSVHESMNDDGIATKTHGERDNMALLKNNR